MPTSKKYSQKTIIDYHPCLAICVYHKESDLIDIPQYIDSLVGDGIYDYYIYVFMAWIWQNWFFMQYQGRKIYD